MARLILILRIESHGLRGRMLSLLIAEKVLPLCSGTCVKAIVKPQWILKGLEEVQSQLGNFLFHPAHLQDGK